jgi:hypothetical protein
VNFGGPKDQKNQEEKRKTRYDVSLLLRVCCIEEQSNTTKGFSITKAFINHNMTLLKKYILLSSLQMFTGHYCEATLCCATVAALTEVIWSAHKCDFKRGFHKRSNQGKGR